MRARKTSKAVADGFHEAKNRAEDVQRRAQDQAETMRIRAAEVRKKAEKVRTRAYDEAEALRRKAADVREQAERARVKAKAAKDSVVAAKDKVVQLKNQMRERITSKADARKFSSDCRTLVPSESKKMPLVRTRFS